MKIMKTGRKLLVIVCAFAAVVVEAAMGAQSTEKSKFRRLNKPIHGEYIVVLKSPIRDDEILRTAEKVARERGGGY